MAGAKVLSVDPSGDGNPTNVTTTLAFVLSHKLATAGVNIVAQYASGAALNDAAGPFVCQLPVRSVRLVLGVGGANPVAVTVEGTINGATISETISCTGAGTYEGTKLFDTITKVRSNIDPGGTLDVRTGLLAGLGFACASIDLLSCDGVLEAIPTKDIATGMFKTTTAPNGTRVFTVRGTRSHTHTTA